MITNFTPKAVYIQNMETGETHKLDGVTEMTVDDITTHDELYEFIKSHNLNTVIPTTFEEIEFREEENE